MYYYYYKQQSENSLFPHIEKVIKNTTIRISLFRTVEYFHVLIIHVKIPEKQVRPKNCRNRISNIYIIYYILLLLSIISIRY